MRRTRPLRISDPRGFTLVESIIVLVLLSLAAVAIVSMQGNIFKEVSGNKELQVGVQVMQECAEQILANRQYSGGFTNVAACTTGSYGGFTPSVTITNVTNTTACPGTCKQVVISATKSGVTTGLTPVTLMLMSY
ncbi:MAG: type II secretion system protein [Acidobacteriota bacterium]